jgi:HK97 family phage major capsid protein
MEDGMTLNEMRAALGDLRDQFAAVFMDADGNRVADEDATDEMIADAERLNSEIEAMQEKITAAEARVAKAGELRRSADAQRQAKTQPLPRRTAPQSGAGETAISSGVRDLRSDDPMRGFGSYDEFARAVVTAFSPGASIDSRLLNISAADYANTDTGSEGGFLVPPDFSDRMVERMQKRLPIMDAADKFTLVGNSTEVPAYIDDDQSDASSRYGGVRVYWEGEGDQGTRSKASFRKVTLRLRKLMALSDVTSEMMEDVQNFGSMMLAKHADAISGELTEAFMFGSGAGQPMGAFTGSTHCVQVAKETGQDKDTITYQNILGMISAIMDTPGGGGFWMANREVIPQLLSLNQAVGTGGAVVYPPAGGSIANPVPTTINGQPLIYTDHCEALGDAGDIVFGNFAYYLVAMKGSIETAMSIHLYFDYDRQAFRSTFRVDGRPAFQKTTKPRKGASSRRVGPFVKLAERA